MKNVLIVLIDCLRQDRIEGREKTAHIPNIDALKKRSFSFDNSHAVGSNTNSVLSSWFTGLYPFNSGIRNFRDRQFSPNVETIATVLQAQGYLTLATVTDAIESATDLLKGFTVIERRNKWKQAIYNGYGKRVCEQVASLNKQSQPWFYFVHTAELHQVRQCDPAFASARYGESFYDRGLSCVDHYLGHILDEVDFSDTTVILFGDHGDNLLWEPASSWLSFVASALRSDVRRLPGVWQLRDWFFRHGMFSPSKNLLRNNFLFHHDYHIYKFLTHSPLLIATPGHSQAERIGEVVSSVDILPTILDCLDLPVPQDLDGLSLKPLMDNPTSRLPKRTIYQEVVTDFVWKKRNLADSSLPVMTAVMNEQWKLITSSLDEHAEPELYNLHDDPDEQSNLFRQYKDTEVVKSLLQELAQQKVPSGQLSSVK
jgi:arylsulfatase A-like enzyme